MGNGVKLSTTRTQETHSLESVDFPTEIRVFALVDVAQLQRSVIVRRLDGHQDVLANGHRQHRVAIVVDVFADQIDSKPVERKTLC